MSAPAIHLHGALRTAAAELIAPFDVTLPAGRWNVVLGASGVGKTSLLRLIAGLPSAVHLTGGVSASDGLPLRPRVAMMAQDDHLLGWADARANVAIGARLRSERPDLERAAALLDAVGLAAQQRRKPTALSAGQRQRVALARTLYEDRPVVLLDEPFSALDAPTRLQMQDLAARLLERRTVVLITHDPTEAARLADLAWIVSPAGLTPCALPKTPAPRRPEAPETLASQAALLRQLSVAAQVPA